MADDVAVEGLGEGVLHALAEAHHLGLLGHHVHHHVGGQAVAPVGEPLDQIGIGDGCHPDGPALVVDLGGVVGVLKLADHVAECAHLAVAQVLGGGAIQCGDLIEGDLADILGELPVLHGEEIPVGRRPEDGGGQDGAHQGHGDQGQKQDAHGETLLLDEAQVVLHPAAAGGHVHAGGDQGTQDIHHAEDTHEGVEVTGLEVDGRQGHIEIDQAHHGGDEQADQDLAQPALGALSVFRRFLFHSFASPLRRWGVLKVVYPKFRNMARGYRPTTALPRHLPRRYAAALIARPTAQPMG